MARKKVSKIDDEHEDQMEMAADNMPKTANLKKSDPIYKAAKKYLDICDEIATVKEELDEKKQQARKKVIGMLIDGGHESVIVDGATFSHIHKSAIDELRVYRKKASKEIENDEE